jgi:tripartite-type tricarboxylate transporter receptor subunit TctC
VLLVNDQQPWKTLKEFIDDAKQRPNAILYSSGGLYGATHLPMALLSTAAGGLQMRHLPTNGGGPAITAILGNNVQATAQTVSASLAHIKTGKLRPLALYGGTRSKVLPDVPTLKELGYDVEYYLWVGLFAPKGTPAQIVSTLGGAIDKAAHNDQFTATLANLGLDLAYLNGADFATFWEADIKRVGEAVRAIGRVQG